MKQVAMKVNSANLVKSLKYSFTNKTTVLGELMQNARRAGATQVFFEFTPEANILRVTDDGCGIDSIETLLTVAESGWDADVIAQEHPFGIGFLSALFACKHITVVSKSGRISANTDDILSFKTITVAPVTDWDGVTTITMQDVDLELAKIEALLIRLSKGFPIPVIFNGESLQRSHALDSAFSFIETEIGAVYVSGLDEPDGSREDFEVYLQGLPVYSSTTYKPEKQHIIHLDSSRFYARLPDRDKLIDEAEVVQIIKSVLKQEIEKKLIALKAMLSAEALVCFYDMMQHWHLLTLLNDVPVVPGQVLSEIDEYPVCNLSCNSFMSNLRNSLTRSEVESRGVVDIDDDISSEGAARYMFARERENLIYDGGLDKDHWLHTIVRKLSKEAVTIETINETHGARFEGQWVWVYVRFCDAYRINIGNDTVEITSDALYRGQEDGDDVIVPKDEASGFVLKQVSSYLSEHEEYQESTYESDMAEFESFVIANTASNPADAMKRLLPGFSGCPSLYSKSFVITLNDEGRVASVTAA